VVGGAAVAAGLPAAVASVLIEEPLARSRGIFIDPVPVLTDVRVLAGTALLLAVAAVLAVALGAVLRRSAVAVTAVIAVIVLPYFFAVPLALLPARAADWLLRVTPAAGFAIQQPYPAYPQVASSCNPQNGYYPLAPWAGFAVLCAWTALVLGLAMYLAIGAVLGLLYLFPIIGAVLGGSHLARLFQQIGPMTAGLAIQATTGLRNLPIGPWAGLGVLAAWAAAALLAGGLLLRHRDA
jgi:hypothetical protein